MSQTSTTWHDRFAPMEDVPGVGVWVPSDRVRVDVTAAQTPVYSAAEEQRWSEICAANPRVHDGAILCVAGVEHLQNVVRCERDKYKRLAVGGAVRILGVKGWVTGRDKDGGEHLLIGRRGEQTRVYAGVWESAPAGGVDPPCENVTALSEADLAASLAEEAEEELGFELDIRGARVRAICRDYIAMSDDVFVATELPEPIDPRRAPSCQHGRCGWEYSDTAWLSRVDAKGFDAKLVAPTRAVLRVMRWV